MRRSYRLCTNPTSNHRRTALFPGSLNPAPKSTTVAATTAAQPQPLRLRLLPRTLTSRTTPRTTTTMATQAPSGDADIQLYSLATPNGQKISVALEEMGLSYDAHTIDIRKNVQFEPWFVAINPNSKIPAIVDKTGGTNGQPLAVFESGAILLHLAEKSGKLLPSDPTKRSETIQWLFWQVGGFGPMLGQMGHFHKYAKEDVPYAKERYFKESQRLFGVLEKRLEGRQFVVGDEYTIADIAIFPWVLGVDRFYNLKKELGDFPNIDRWLATITERPAVKKGLTVCGFP